MIFGSTVWIRPYGRTAEKRIEELKNLLMTMTR